MTTFVDLYFPPGLPLDRDEIQRAIEEALGDALEVVGAGVGATGSNLDLEIVAAELPEATLATLVQTLFRLGIPDETSVAISDPAEKVTLGELRRRLASTA